MAGDALVGGESDREGEGLVRASIGRIEGDSGRILVTDGGEEGKPVVPVHRAACSRLRLTQDRRQARAGLMQ